MGCISSNLLAKSGSFSQKVNQTFQKRSNVLEEILISNSKNNGDKQFLAVLCSPNTLTQNPKPNSETNGPEQNPNPIEPKKDLNPSFDASDIETINTWELLAGLEEEEEEDKKENQEEKQEQKGRSFRTIEDLNAILALSESVDSNNTSTSAITGTSSTGTKRKARAKELTELKLPAFEFVKSVSLRDWLSKGGQIFSPGSYITPKIGSGQKERSVIGKNQDELKNQEVFDPEMLRQFEEAIEEMRREEESILKEIVGSLEDGNGEKKRLSMILEKDFIELKGQDISDALAQY